MRGRLVAAAKEGWTMVRPLAIVAFAAIAGISPLAHADDPRSTVTITSTSASVSTAKSGTTLDLDAFVNRWSSALVSSGFLRNVTLTARGEPTRDGSTTTTQRHLFAEIQFADRAIPVLFALEEKRREWTHYQPTLTLTLTGPLVSYENVTPHESIEALLGGKQSMTWTYDPDSSSNTLRAEFSVLSLQFERNILRILQSRFEGVLKTYNVTVDQNFILGGISRVLREVNEGVLR
jgi:hypothetical protein